MSSLTKGNKVAVEEADIALLPDADDTGSASLATSQRFVTGAPGTRVVVVANGEFHVQGGEGDVEATTGSPGPFPAGAYKFTVPDGVTHVALIQGAAGAAAGCAYRG